jgi:hypothetical protein
MICWRMDWRMLRRTELAYRPKMGRDWFDG